MSKQNGRNSNPDDHSRDDGNDANSDKWISHYSLPQYVFFFQDPGSIALLWNPTQVVAYHDASHQCKPADDSGDRWVVQINVGPEDVVHPPGLRGSQHGSALIQHWRFLGQPQPRQPRKPVPWGQASYESPSYGRGPSSES